MPRANMKRLIDTALMVRYEQGFAKIIYDEGVTTDEDVVAAMERVRKMWGQKSVVVDPALSTITKIHEIILEL